MRPAETIDKLIKKLHLTASAELDERVHSEISKALAEPKEIEAAKLEPNVWRIIMKSRIAKFAAAAAVIIIAVLTGLPFFSGNGSGVALADVLERIEQVQAFMYRVETAMTGNMTPGMPTGKQEMQGTIIISNEYGMKMEMDVTDANTGEKIVQQMYVIPDQKAMFMVMPVQKKYSRVEFDDDLLARMKKQNNDPREMVKQIMRCEYTELGRSVVDGIEVEGFETTDPSFMGGMAEDVTIRLWVDTTSWLPVRQELDVKVNEQMQMQGVVYDYQWDIQVDASEFEPDIPEDFTVFPTHGMKLSLSEEAAIEGLKFFAEILERYPKKLNLMDLMREFEASSDREDKIENLTDGALKLTEEMEKMTEDEKTKKTMEMMRLFQSPSIFYMTLVQDKKEPAYYGESVGPDDGNMVLMRWKVSDDQYRVIFGDLSAEDVTAEELAELEKLFSE